MARFVLRYDLRAPSFGAPARDLYAAAVDQAAWADEHGFDRVFVMEHHGAEDGYCPSPLILGSAIASRTRRLRIQTCALVLPLHDPVRLAEDIAVLDLVSGGRVDLVLAAGYRPKEFAMFGRDPRRRPSMMDEGVRVLRQAWTGEPFRFREAEIRVTPRPLQRPHPPLMLGGSTEAAARRAARLGDGFFPTHHDPTLVEAYADERRRLGRDNGPVLMTRWIFLHVSLDPAGDWERIKPHALHEANSYARWLWESRTPGPFAPIEDADSLLKRRLYRVVTPDECVALARRLGPEELFVFHPLMGGLDPEMGWASLRLFAERVLPEIDVS